MTTQTPNNDKVAMFVEQLEMAYAIEFIYNGDSYSIDATHEEVGDNIYRTSGRGFEVWKYDGNADDGKVIAFADSAIGILNVPCFDGKTFIDVMNQIEAV